VSELEQNLWKIAYLFIIAGACTGIGFVFGRGLSMVKEWIQRDKKSKVP